MGSIGKPCDPKAASTSGFGVGVSGQSDILPEQKFPSGRCYFPGAFGKRLGSMTFLAPPERVAS
jgi:hypothetical protein